MVMRRYPAAIRKDADMDMGVDFWQSVAMYTQLDRICLGGLLIVSGILKLRVFENFVKSVLMLALVRPRIAIAAARSLPFVELILGSLLIVGYQSRLVAGTTAVLMLVFAGVVTVILMKDTSAPCMCFGAPTPMSGAIVVRNLGLAALGITVAIGPESASSQTYGPVLAIVGTVVVIWVLREWRPHVPKGG